MARISQNQINALVLSGITNNKEDVATYSEQISSGIKVKKPGDSNLSATLSQYNETLRKLDGYKTQVTSVQGVLTFQDDVLNQMNELLVRAKEIATQGANEVNGVEVRRQVAEEIFQIRDHVISLANSTYQGKYVFGAAADDVPPYSALANTEPATGPASQRYFYDTTRPGSDVVRTVNVTDQLTVEVNIPGNEIFDNSVYALERLGRSLQGYKTTPAVGQPDGGGTAYTEAEYDLQSDDIQNSIELLTTAREEDIMPQRVQVASKLRRLDTAEALLQLTRTNAEDLVAKLQQVDVAEAATNLSQAQTALQASYTVSTRILNLSILDFI